LHNIVVDLVAEVRVRLEQPWILNPSGHLDALPFVSRSRGREPDS
jgi:hypothetical protein